MRFYAVRFLKLKQMETATKHTQGEWRTELNNRGKETRVYAYLNKFICDVRGRNGSFDGDEYQNEANAKLIAAAPDLLEACKSIYDKMIQSANMSIAAEEHYKEAIDKCEAAIKKVTE